MPRSGRLDIPHLLQHVIVRGIERRNIFLNDDDRSDFMERFEMLLEKTGVECLAWALMSNHFHLLLRPTLTTLATFMRRLLTGYAVTFNLRHSRSGHLFQNRYKSLVCDEDAYLLELVRYIHLNPVRVGMAPDLDALEPFPWSGHAVLMGRRAMKGQVTDEVLRYFGKNITAARRGYRNFVEDGVSQGKRNDLISSRGAVSNNDAPRTIQDSRILGDEDFVERLRSESTLRERIAAPEPIYAIIGRFAEEFDVSPRAVASRSRHPRILNARAAVCHAAIDAGHSGAEVSRHLQMTRSGVFTARKRRQTIMEHAEDEP